MSEYDRYEQKEPMKLKIARRRVPLGVKFVKGEEARDHVVAINKYIYFYRYFETRIAIRKGDVFLAHFEYECGNELSGNHFVVALLDSNANNQVVTVVPLKSMKGRPLNPASDILVGEIQGLKNGKEAVAIINQLRTIDKRRLFDFNTISHLEQYLHGDTIGEYSDIEVTLKRVYRLNSLQYRKLHKAAEEYIYNGFISHSYS